MNADDDVALLPGNLWQHGPTARCWMIDVRASCASTNSLLLEDARELASAVALEQTAGAAGAVVRGRRDRATA
jgi:hypothetical protein